ncbi:MAG: hypothetical protein GY936_08250 [Ignavibacteriae bacterium]|nr:hypothetical protein [Ignavibacteriota bacterium]
MNKLIIISFVSSLLLFSCENNNKVEVSEQKEENNILDLRKEKITQQNKIDNLKKEIDLLKNKRDSIRALDSLNAKKDQ